MARRRDPREEQLRRQARTERRRDSYRPGHSVHWIQARKAREAMSESEPGRIRAVDYDGVHVLVAGEVRRYWANDLDRVANLVTSYGTKVRIQERWSIMWIARQHLVSIRGPLPGAHQREGS